MNAPKTGPPADRRVRPALIALAWLWVAAPFGYGLWELVAKATQLFSA
jgi:hypothetical protein